jgi:hypothetical protein
MSSQTSLSRSGDYNGFTFGSDDAGQSRLVVTDELDSIFPLRIAPSFLEDGLKQGKWLVVSMSVWSIHQEDEIEGITGEANRHPVREPGHACGLVRA